jgi:hypothetical protein
MATQFPQTKNPLILRYHRLMDAFAKSDDERDFYLDRVEGFLLYVDLDKPQEELEALEKELSGSSGARYCLLPKMTFYEIKKFMEGFVQEKVYDIDTKEKLLDIISAKDSRENFLEFIYDHITELEKWQLYYQERFRIRIIEWLRQQNMQFVFEEELDLGRGTIEKVKRYQFDSKAPKEVMQTRELLLAKSKIYYSTEALNPRPKRGRPPKQVAKIEVEPQLTVDLYTQVTPTCRHFLYTPDITNAASVTFSAKFESEEHLLASLRGTTRLRVDAKLEALSQRLESLRTLSDRLSGKEARPITGGVTTTLPTRVFEAKVVPSGGEIRVNKAIESAAGDLMPKKRGRPRKEEEVPSPKRRFSVKKVSQIKTNKEDK